MDWGRGSVGRVLGYHVRSPDSHTHLGMDQVIPSLREAGGLSVQGHPQSHRELEAGFQETPS